MLVVILILLAFIYKQQMPVSQKLKIYVNEDQSRIVLEKLPTKTFVEEDSSNIGS